MGRWRETRGEREGGPAWAPPWWAAPVTMVTIGLAAAIASVLAR